MLDRKLMAHWTAMLDGNPPGKPRNGRVPHKFGVKTEGYWPSVVRQLIREVERLDGLADTSTVDTQSR